MDAINCLVAEHENILRLTAVVRKACLNMLSGEEVNIKDFRCIITFIRIYADKSHHGKEEAFLFQEMEENLGDLAQTLIRNGMLVEHDLGRLYVKQLEDAVNGYEEECSLEHKLDVIVNAMAYTDLLKRHIERENGAVYPFAQRGLTKEILKTIDQKTQVFEDEHRGEREEQLAVLDALEKMYFL